MSGRERNRGRAKNGPRGRGGFRGRSRPYRHNQRPWKYHENSDWNRRHWSTRMQDIHPENPIRPQDSNFEQNVFNNYYQFDNFQSSNEPEEIDPPLPGSEAERSNKIELDKKRIREALSSATDTNQLLNFNNSSTECGPKDKQPPTKKFNSTVPELRLTANDLMEIGSVAGKQLENNDNIEDIEEPGETNDRYISQRFNIVSDSNKNIEQQNNKSTGNRHQSGGWKSFQIPTDFMEINVQGRSTSTSSPKQYPANREERILGDILHSKDSRYVEPKTPNKKDSDRIGRLYTSFLKARYFGKRFKSSKSGELRKQMLENPLLDASVAESHNVPNKNEGQKENVKKPNMDEEEPSMPLPINIKMEMRETSAEQIEAESREELEANEFLNEYSYLLTPNFTIPAETLEELGLSYLLNDFPSTEKDQSNFVSDHNFRTPSSSDTGQSKSDKFLRVKSLSTLNSTPFTDQLTLHPGQSPRTNENINFSLALQTSRQSLSPDSRTSVPSSSPGRSVPNQSFHNVTEKRSIVNKSTDTVMETNGLNMEHVVNEVVEKILSSTRIGSRNVLSERSSTQENETIPFAELEDIVAKFKRTVNATIYSQNTSEKQVNLSEIHGNYRQTDLNIQNDFSIINQASTSNLISYDSNRSTKSEQTGECSLTCQSRSQLKDVSDKMLKMFLIDKQIQQLMEEKIKLYNELMSAKEIASTFFNSWAKENQGIGIRNKMANTAMPTQVETQQIVTEDPNGNKFYSHAEKSQDNNLLNTKNYNNKNPTVSASEPSGLNDLLNNVEAVKQYLMSFQKNTIAGALNACEESLLEMKKETISKDENVEVIDETNFSNPNTGVQSDSDKDKTNKKRKKKNVTLSGNSKPGKKKRREENKSNNENLPEIIAVNDIQNRNATDEIIEINSDDENEKFEDLYETKFEPGKLKEMNKAPATDGQENKKKNKLKEEIVLQFNHEDETVLCMKVSEVNQVCVAGCRDGKLLIYSLKNGELKMRIKAHEESITCLTEYKGMIISGSTDLTLRCFRMKTGKELNRVHVGYAVQCMDLKYDSLFVGTKVGLLYIYSVKETLTLVDDPLNLTDSSILAVRAAKEGVRNILIVAARGQQISIRDATTGLLIRTFTWCDTVYCLEFAGASPIVYCGTRTKSVVAVDFINGEEKFKCDAGRGVSQIHFAYDLMFTACYDGKVYVYDYKKKNLVTSIVVSKGMLLSLIVYKNKIIVATTRSEFLVVSFPKELKRYLNAEEKT